MSNAVQTLLTYLLNEGKQKNVFTLQFITKALTWSFSFFISGFLGEQFNPLRLQQPSNIRLG